MANSVFANAREIGSKKGGGKIISVFPDVCLTPSPSGPIPIPFPKFGPDSDNTRGVKKTKIAGKNISTKNSKYSKIQDSGRMGKKSNVRVSSTSLGRYLGNVPLVTYLLDQARKKGYKVLVVNQNGSAKLLISPERNSHGKKSMISRTLSDKTNANLSVLRKAVFFLDKMPVVLEGRSSVHFKDFITQNHL